MAAASAGAGELHEAINTGLEFRRLLGVPFKLRNKPVSIVTTLKEYIKTDRALGKMKTAEDIANLPELTDESIMMSQRILGLLIPPVYTAQPTLFPLLIFAMVRASLEFGIDANSCDAFGGYGVILCGAFGKFQEGKKMARAVELMLEKPGDYARMKSAAIYKCEVFIRKYILLVLKNVLL